MYATAGRFAGRTAGLAYRWAQANRSYLRGQAENQLFNMAWSGSRRYRRRGKRLMRRFGRRVYRKTGARRLGSRKRFKSSVGRPISRAITKRYQTGSDGYASVSTLQFYANWEITEFPARKNTANQDLFRRERDVINFSGFKINFNWRNNLNENIYLNFAIVHPHDETLPVGSGFFRNPGNGTDSRETNWVGTLSGLALHKTKINTDRYDVLYHRRVTIGPVTNALGIHPDRPNWTTLSKYFRIKRQLRFASGTDTNPEEGRLFGIVWCTVMGSPSTASSIANAVSQDHLITRYYREVFQ